MVGLRTEMDRLSHTDVRQRRIALRRLKDLDDPAALPAFLPLLGSDDAWFRSHALDAIERWASLEDQTVLNACLEEGSVEAKLLTLHLLDTWGLVQDRRLMDLSADEVEEVAVRAWSIRMSCAEPPWESASVHPIPRVRALAMRSEAPRGILERGTGDDSSSVRRAALVAMIDRTGEADIVIQGLDRAGLQAMMLRLEALPIDVAKEVIERVATEHPSDAARAVDAPSDWTWRERRPCWDPHAAILTFTRGCSSSSEANAGMITDGGRWNRTRPPSSTGATSSIGSFDPNHRFMLRVSRLCSHTTGKDLDTSDWFEVFGTFSRPLRPQNRGWIEDGRRTLEAGTPIRRDVQDLVVIRGTSTTPTHPRDPAGGTCLDRRWRSARPPLEGPLG